MLINIDIRYDHKFFLPYSSRRNEIDDSVKELQEILYAVVSENISNTKLMRDFFTFTIAPSVTAKAANLTAMQTQNDAIVLLFKSKSGDC
jgi:hypothetical protein